MTSTQTTMVPAAAVLSTWHAHDWQDGISVGQLNALDRVTIHTRHSVYEIIISSPANGDVLVRGGEFFRDFTPVRLAGCTLGGSFLKVRSIHIGFRVEFSLGQNFVLTSPVQSISVRCDAKVAG